MVMLTCVCSVSVSVCVFVCACLFLFLSVSVISFAFWRARDPSLAFFLIVETCLELSWYRSAFTWLFLFLSVECVLVKCCSSVEIFVSCHIHHHFVAFADRCRFLLTTSPSVAIGWLYWHLWIYVDVFTCFFFVFVFWVLNMFFRL